mmetsp:Transcript_9778/g.24737  ORF Transcript_9778/g.24737 Transcript_9778/m.24737 type:complete len:225 (-) Transcript_9778:297-971(-)
MRRAAAATQVARVDQARVEGGHNRILAQILTNKHNLLPPILYLRPSKVLHHVVVCVRTLLRPVVLRQMSHPRPGTAKLTHDARLAPLADEVVSTCEPDVPLASHDVPKLLAGVLRPQLGFLLALHRSIVRIIISARSILASLHLASILLLLRTLVPLLARAHQLQDEMFIQKIHETGRVEWRARLVDEAADAVHLRLGDHGFATHRLEPTRRVRSLVHVKQSGA